MNGTIVIKVNLLFLAMAADREHAIPEILKIKDKWAWIPRDCAELPELLEYAEYHAELEETEFDSYAREMHREARIFVDIVTEVMVEKWENAE